MRCRPLTLALKGDELLHDRPRQRALAPDVVEWPKHPLKLY
jgi:hypothetical protein